MPIWSLVVLGAALGADLSDPSALEEASPRVRPLMTKVDDPSPSSPPPLWFRSSGSGEPGQHVSHRSPLDVTVSVLGRVDSTPSSGSPTPGVFAEIGGNLWPVPEPSPLFVALTAGLSLTGESNGSMQPRLSLTGHVGLGSGDPRWPFRGFQGYSLSLYGGAWSLQVSRRMVGPLWDGELGSVGICPGAACCGVDPAESRPSPRLRRWTWEADGATDGTSSPGRTPWSRWGSRRPSLSS
jgi:hypothetical protein